MTFAVGAVRETKELVDGFDELFLPKDIFPTLSADMFSEDIRSLYGFYQRRCGVTVTRVEDMAKAALVNKPPRLAFRCPIRRFVFIVSPMR